MTVSEKKHQCKVALKIIDSLLDQSSAIKVVDVRIGLRYTAVLLEDDRIGLAYTFREEAQSGCSVFHAHV